MGRAVKKKVLSGRRPTEIEEASEAQLLRTFSKPKSWAELGIKHHAVRATQGRRGRISVDAGFVDFIPTEILDMILLDLDYPSLATLCLVNSKVEFFIKNRPFYKLVVKGCNNVLQELKKRDLIHVHTAKLVYRALISPKCSGPGCQRLGNSLFLPNCRRSCIQCLGYKPLLSAMSLQRAQEKHELHAKDITENVASFQLPGESVSFVSEAEVAELAIRLHGEKPVPPTCTPVWSEKAIVPFPLFDAEKEKLDFGRQCRACYLRFEKHENMWCEIEIQPSGGEMACWKREWRHLRELGLAVLTRKQLLQHVTSGECVEAQKLWSRERLKRMES